MVENLSHAFDLIEPTISTNRDAQQLNSHSAMRYCGETNMKAKQFVRRQNQIFQRALKKDLNRVAMEEEKKLLKLKSG